MTANGSEASIVQLPGRQIKERLAGLREGTAPYHHRVERTVESWGWRGSPARYVGLLARLHGFYEPFEAEIGRAVGRWALPLDVDVRRKGPLTTRDLAVLGTPSSDAAELPRCVRIPRPTNPAFVLGCLYVTEGATLGGRILARQVERHLGYGPRDGASFFHGYGPEVGARWRSFCSLLAAASTSRAAEDAILAGAIETFTAYDDWLSGALRTSRGSRASAARSPKESCRP